MKPLHLAAALLMVSVWGFNFVVMRWGLDQVPPLTLAVLRFSLAAFPMLLLVPWPRARWTLVAAYGLFAFAGQFALLFGGLAAGMPTGLASLVIQVQAFFTIGLAALLAHERPRASQLAGALQDDIVAEGGVDDFSDFYGFPIYAWGKLLEPRAVGVKSDSFRITSGLKGELGGDWRFDGAFLVGGNNRTQRGLSGLVVAKNFYDLNLGNVCTDGTRVRRWDVDLARPDAEFFGDTCEDAGKTTLWYNPFGGQTSQAAGVANLLGTTAKRTAARGSTRSTAASTARFRPGRDR